MGALFDNVSADEARDWKHRNWLEATEPGATPRPVQSLDVVYRCSFFGARCDLDKFLERNEVCALFVVDRANPYFHAERPAHGDGRCQRGVERELYGLASTTKSITSLLFGRVFMDPALGAPLDISSPVVDLLPAGVTYSDPAVTVRDLLQMSSAMEWNDGRDKPRIKALESEACNRNPQGTDCTLRGITIEILEDADFDPGSGERRPFNYSGLDSQLLGVLVEERLSIIPEFMEMLPDHESPNLARGFDHFFWRELGPRKRARWKADYDYRSPAHCCFRMSAGDMALIGAHILNLYTADRGFMGGWLRASVNNSRDTGRGCGFRDFDLRYRYGFQWWVFEDPKDGFTGWGTGGQFLHIFPEQEVVVVQFAKWAPSMIDDRRCEALGVHRLIADQVAAARS
ncbi:MAG: serine hydrolase [Rhodospirillaceae bacterium]|nr:serine hydrolase [Rhodospirillaceae bacterium]MBT6403335.1 serine hydrolase [Rhodospirillaceae bacterium]